MALNREWFPFPIIPLSLWTLYKLSACDFMAMPHFQGDARAKQEMDGVPSDGTSGQLLWLPESHSGIPPNVLGSWFYLDKPRREYLTWTQMIHERFKKF